MGGTARPDLDMAWQMAILLALLMTGCGSRATDPGATTNMRESAAETADRDTGAAAGRSDADDREHSDHAPGEAREHGEVDRVAMTAAQVAALGIGVDTARGGVVSAAVLLTGRVVIDPRRVTAVRARFPGPVVRVYQEVGDRVPKNAPLADIESNESLTVYTVRAPLAGTVLARLTNVGDVAGAEPLYRIGDVTALQIELKAFPDQRTAIRTGARVTFPLGNRSAGGSVIAIAPELDVQTQAVNVRVSLDEAPIETLVPGQFVTASVETARDSVLVAVPPEAVQRLEGRDVVFVPVPDGFETRAVAVGRRAANVVELTSGLAVGGRYVARGAFLLKAELGKAAAHEH